MMKPLPAALMAALFATVALAAPAGATKPRGAVNATAAPLPGTAQRNAIVAASIKRFEENTTKGIAFDVQRIEVRNGWAFIDGLPRLKNGKELDGTKYFDDAYEKSDGLQTQALLRFVKGQWVVKDLVTGAQPADRTWYCGESTPALDKVICK